MTHLGRPDGQVDEAYRTRPLAERLSDLMERPVRHLDDSIGPAVEAAVRAIKAMGISVLIAESNLANATRVCDRLYAIDRGEIIFHGRPGEVFQNAEVIQTIRG